MQSIVLSADYRKQVTALLAGFTRRQGFAGLLTGMFDQKIKEHLGSPRNELATGQRRVHGESTRDPWIQHANQIAAGKIGRHDVYRY